MPIANRPKAAPSAAKQSRAMSPIVARRAVDENPEIHRSRVSIAARSRPRVYVRRCLHEPFDVRRREQLESGTRFVYYAAPKVAAVT